MEGTSDKLFIKPFCGLSIEDNPFKQTIRVLPIDLVFAVGENYESEIVIPEGYKVDYFPKDISQDNKILSIAYSAKQVDNKIVVKAGYQMKQNMYPSADYTRIKATFAAIIDRFSEMIVLSKIE